MSNIYPNCSATSVLVNSDYKNYSKTVVLIFSIGSYSILPVMNVLIYTDVWGVKVSLSVKSCH